ncbi:MAG: NAD-dependent protein deacylase [Candidatus Omnitrophica bacterium]|nr:NAD-dependent protein deacylase [Candidatus Omnitrophota bacterium]
MASFRSIVVLTGAGISAESGLKTFRDAGGLWENHRVEEVASPAAFRRDPATVHRFYNLRRRQLQEPSVRPNAAHLALAELERFFPGEFHLITQNIDDLHERAGSRQVIHMHGELLKARCTGSGAVFPRATDIETGDRCGCCKPPRPLRPHVVWFGEPPLQMDRILQALSECGLFLSIGTSGSVYPAAGFAQTARSRGARTVELNLEPSAVESVFEEKIYGPATRIVPEYVRQLLVALE